MVRHGDIPAGLRAQADLGPQWSAWIERLPRVVNDVLDQWDLVPEQEPLRHGYCAVVIPVLAGDERAMLKVAFDGDDEGAHEALGLRQWSAGPAVRLLRADPRRRALLLERLHSRDLTTVPDIEGCRIVAGLYSRLHVPASPRLPALTAYLDGWLDALQQLPRAASIPRRLVEQAMSIGRNFCTDDRSVGTLIHGDLHYHNVLAADREPWLVIDPKPMSGDPHFEIAPMLWNRLDGYRSGDERKAAVRSRFFEIVDAAALDPDRARDWVVIRMVLNAHWALQDAQRTAKPLQREWITTCIAVAKAVQAR